MEADTHSVNKNYITNQTVTIHWSIIAPLSNFIFQNNKHVYNNPVYTMFGLDRFVLNKNYTMSFICSFFTGQIRR
jgi:hypothetical protein